VFLLVGGVAQLQPNLTTAFLLPDGVFVAPGLESYGPRNARLMLLGVG